MPEHAIHDPYVAEVGEKVEHIYRDVRELRKVHPTHLVPRYNKIYDTLRSEQAWRYMADNWANGTFATSLTAAVTQAVKFNIPYNARLSQWPDGIQYHLVVRRFSIAPTTTQAGELECTYEDASGFVVPLGEFLANSGGSYSYDDVIPSAITDPSNTNVGTLRVTLNGGVTTPPTIFWMMAFSYAYLLPSRHGYDLMPEEAWKHE